MEAVDTAPAARGRRVRGRPPRTCVVVTERDERDEREKKDRGFVLRRDGEERSARRLSKAENGEPSVKS